jgi:hypothetical protein
MIVKRILICIAAVVLLGFAGRKVLSARAEGPNGAQGGPATCVAPKAWGNFKAYDGSGGGFVFEDSAGVIRIGSGCSGTILRLHVEIHRE